MKEYLVRNDIVSEGVIFPSNHLTMPIQWVLIPLCPLKTQGHHKNQTENEYPPFGSMPVCLYRKCSSKKY
jgi:hypothetical protein